MRLSNAAQFHTVVTTFPDRAFDATIVDGGDETDPDTVGRVASVEASRHTVRAGGIIVVDNSDRRRYRCIDEVMAEWHVKRYVSLQVVPLTASETSIYLMANADRDTAVEVRSGLR